MSLIRISESENWIADYDTERGMYKVSYFENGHFVDQYRFDEYRVENYSLQKALNKRMNKVNQDILSGKGLSKL
jgi:hypothetical protein